MLSVALHGSCPSRKQPNGSEHNFLETINNPISSSDRYELDLQPCLWLPIPLDLETPDEDVHYTQRNSTKMFNLKWMKRLVTRLILANSLHVAVKHILLEDKSPRRRLLHWIHMVIFAYGPLRCATLYWQISSGKPWPFDVAWQVHSQFVKWPAPIVACYWAMSAFVVYFNYFMFDKYLMQGECRVGQYWFDWFVRVTGTKIHSISHDLLINNVIQIFNQNRKLFSSFEPKQLKKHPLRRSMDFVKMQLAAWNWNKACKSSPHLLKMDHTLASFPFMPNQVKSRVFVISLGLELMSVLNLVFVGLFASLLLSVYVYKLMLVDCSGLVRVVVLVEWVYFAVLALMLAKLLLVTILVIITPIYCFSMQLNHLNCNVQRFVASGRSLCCPLRVHLKVIHFLRVQHNLICHVLYLSHAISEFALMTALFNVPTNILMTVTSYVNVDSLVGELISLLVLTTQFVAIGGPFLLIVNLTETIFRCRPYFIPLQANTKWLSLKMKLDFAHELINNENHVGIEASVFGVFTHRKLYEVGARVID